MFENAPVASMLANVVLFLLICALLLGVAGKIGGFASAMGPGKKTLMTAVLGYFLLIFLSSYLFFRFFWAPFLGYHTEPCSVPTPTDQVSVTQTTEPTSEGEGK